VHWEPRPGALRFHPDKENEIPDEFCARRTTARPGSIEIGKQGRGIVRWFLSWDNEPRGGFTATLTKPDSFSVQSDADASSSVRDVHIDEMPKASLEDFFRRI
jgi:hypothetical protein